MNVESAGALQLLLPAVRKRLRLQHASQVLKAAAWIIVALSGVAIVAHFFVHSVELRWLGAALAVILAGTLAGSLVQRPSRVECADWADRHLDGNSAFATYLETSAAGNAADMPALAHLRTYVDERARHAGTMLRQLAPERSFARPLAAAFVCTVLTTALLQIPGRGPTADDDSVASGPDTARESTSLSPTEDQSAADDLQDNLSAIDPQQGGPRSPDGSQREPDAAGAQLTRQLPAKSGGTTTANPQSTAEAVEVDDEGATDQGVSKEAGSGREAGSSRDSSDGMQASTAWQGELVAKLRSLTSRSDSSQQQADPERAGEYSAPGAATQDALVERSSVEPLAASAPSAGDAAPLDPATRAYVRRYFDSAGDEQ